MTPGDYLKAIRRRWFDVVLAVLVAVGAGWAITNVSPPGPVRKTYQATAVLVQTGNPYNAGVTNISALGALAKVGQVPQRVAERLNYQGSPLSLASAIHVGVDTQAGVLRISANAATPDRATKLANAFAHQIVGFLQDQQARAQAGETATLTQQLDQMKGDITRLDQQIAHTPAGTAHDLLVEQRDAKIQQYGVQYTAYLQLAQAANQDATLRIVQSAYARPLSTGGFQAPRGIISRVLLAGFLGLISGIVLVLFLDRFDRRIRSRKDAEKSFGLPVLAEIPRLKRVRRRHRELVVVAQPRSHAADAFRITATMVEMMVIKGVPPSAGPDGNGLEGNGHHDGPIVLDPSRGSRILIVSAGPEEGKTFVAANLAAALGIRGDRVTVIGCDLRRPRIHRLFGAGNAWGLTDVLGPEPTPPLVFQRTAVEGVQLVSSGPPTDGTARLLGSPKLPQVLEAAQARSDVVLIDTAPLLTTADAGELVRHADGVVIVARAGRTTAEVAERTTELLKRLGAPLLGVVLNVTSEMSVPRRYYSYRSYRRPRRSDRGKPQLVSHSLKG